jgi:hypothetical protein
MDNFDLKRYLSNNPLLNEIRVITPNTFSDKDIEALITLTDNYGEGISEIDRDSPIKETYSLEDYEYDPEEDDNTSSENRKHRAIKHLLNNKPKGTYVLYDIHGLPSAPGAPANPFETRVTIDKNDQSVSVESPYLDEDGNYYIGWFGQDKKYYPDTANFTEDGEYIGGAE